MSKLLLLLFCALFFSTACNPDIADVNSDQINEVRSEVGLPELIRLELLDNFAVGHAKEMADAGTIYHTTDWSGLPPNYISGRENVGMGSDPEEIQRALEASPPHYSAIVGDYTHYGVGVWESQGVYYITQIFLKL